MAQALEAAIAHLERVLNNQRQAGFIVLVTRGNPTCPPSAELTPEFMEYDESVFEIVESAVNRGIYTAVVGVDPDGALDPNGVDRNMVLEQLALAGYPEGPNDHPVYDMDLDDLRGVLEWAHNYPRPCVLHADNFEQAWSVAAGQTLKVQIAGQTYDEPLPFEEACAFWSGYWCADPSCEAITFCGSACDALAEGVSSVQLSILCSPES